MFFKVNGGSFKMNSHWLRWFLHKKMNLSKRQPTTASQKLPPNWEDLVQKMIYRVSILAFQFDIPKDLVVNSDQTGVQLVPKGKKSWAVKGSKDIPIIGNDDTRQITGNIYNK